MEKYYIIIQAAIVLLVVLMGTFTAKRFNFIHGALAFIAIITFVSGISAILCQYAVKSTEVVEDLGLANYNLNIYSAFTFGTEYLKGTEGTLEVITRYMIYFTLPLQIVSCFFVNCIFVFDLPDAINEYAWIFFFVPTVIWLVSRIISGIFRR